MGVMSDGSLAAGQAALGAGRWAEARDAFEAVLAERESAEASAGLGAALWWLGDSAAGVTHKSRAYALFRRDGDLMGAVQTAVWLGIIYKSDFSNFAAANGWLGRAERLLGDVAPGPLHGWVQVARAYRMEDLDAAATLTEEASELARAAGDADLELTALAQLGLIQIGQGRTSEGFALIDEAVAAALAGERSSLDTVVYACCDMLSACELASDAERAAQWCRVADEFVDTYGCPFLYAECRIFYGSVLTAKGRWDDAEDALRAGLRTTDGTSPGLHTRALTRLAALRVRQGRLEDAGRLLERATEGGEEEAEAAVSIAALMLARGDAAGASQRLLRHLADLAAHRYHLATALDLLVDAHLARSDPGAAHAAAARLAALAAAADSPRLEALAAAARGRTGAARGEGGAAAQLRAALAAWTRLEFPFEAARARYDLGRTLAVSDRNAAIDHLRRALDGFEDLGATLESDRAAAALRALGVPARTGAKGVGLLTDRERQVLELLAAGLSNPEIAERLHVSRKTAAHHVSHILTKLGLRNRAEAAAYAATASA
jgi:ATP/maltotriose-dependent transcriptional regulator MalT